jgi:integrase
MIPWKKPISRFSSDPTRTARSRKRLNSSHAVSGTRQQLWQGRGCSPRPVCSTLCHVVLIHMVFHSPRWRPLDQGSHFYAWREVRAKAGLRHVRWHHWRHFCATQLLELGLDHFAVSIQLGHTAGGALVMERYGHPSQDAARARLLAAFSFDGAQTGSATGSTDYRETHGDAG